MRRYCPELINRPLVNFFERTFPLWLWGSGITLLTAGWLLGGWQLGLSWLVWGMCVRMVAAYHSTWFVNSATHLWGYRNYDTRDASRNLWRVAILAYGEGWHNNHHAHPSVAPAGRKWWEVDITWWSIRLLKAVGLAWTSATSCPRDAPLTMSTTCRKSPHQKLWLPKQPHSRSRPPQILVPELRRISIRRSRR
jgi:stearoyl-CoA desaturase (delta-9 desaturase)